MFRPRVIPCLLLKNKGLVKTIKFKDTTYIGDPMNAVRIFNDKKADELIFLDIDASKENRTIPLELVERIGNECDMPFTVGGGIKTVEQIRDILSAGAEKVSINSSAIENPGLITEASDKFGSQSIVVSIDVKKKLFGKHEVYSNNGKKSTGLNALDHAKSAGEKGAGEILINSIDRDGTMQGYDIELIKEISSAVSIPVISCGGAGKLEDFKNAVTSGGASAVSAGSFFVFHGKLRAVLINFPSREELKKLFL